MRVSCEHCGGAHPKYECRHKKSSGGSSEVEHRTSNSGVEGSIPSRRSKKSTGSHAPAISKRGLTGARVNADDVREGETTSLSLPVDTIPKPKHIDRHKPGYMSTYMRSYRARKAKLKAEREEK